MGTSSGTRANRGQAFGCGRLFGFCRSGQSSRCYEARGMGLIGAMGQMGPMMAAPYQEEVEAVIGAFETDPRHGLTEAEAQARLERDGHNELMGEKPVPAWKRFLAQFSN